MFISFFFLNPTLVRYSSLRLVARELSDSNLGCLDTPTVVNKFAFITQRKIFTLIKDIDKNDFSK